MSLPSHCDAMLTTQDAKALYAELDCLLEALRHVDVQGRASRMQDLDDALGSAEVLLEALEDAYAE